MKEYFTLQINEGKINNLKCLNLNCSYIPTLSVLENILEKGLIEKMIKFKKKKEILLDPNKILCCYKDCNSFAYLNHNNINKPLNLKEKEQVRKEKRKIQSIHTEADDVNDIIKVPEAIKDIEEANEEKATVNNQLEIQVKTEDDLIVLE